VPPEIAAAAAVALNTGTAGEIEKMYGSRTYLFSLIPIPAADYVNVYGRDITEHKRAEEEGRRSEARYRELFEHMSEGLAYCRMLCENGEWNNFVYLAVNNAFETLTGLKNVTGKRVSEVIPGIRETDPELFKTYARVALAGKPEKFEFFVEALNMWFSVSTYSPEKEYFVAVFDVITERKRAEEALRRSEADLKQAQRIAHVGNFLWDVASNTSVWSGEVYRIFGRDPKLPKPEGSECSSFYAPEISRSSGLTERELG
jgi:PAS domain S-box-containing protein